MIDNSFKKSSTQMFIKHVFNTRINIFRICDQLCFLRDELEFMTFDREFLTSQLNKKIQFCFFVIFVNVFDLYRNMYKFLIEIYALSTTLSHKERQKNINCFVLILNSCYALVPSTSTPYLVIASSLSDQAKLAR